MRFESSMIFTNFDAVNHLTDCETSRCERSSLAGKSYEMPFATTVSSAIKTKD